MRTSLEILFDESPQPLAFYNFNLQHLGRFSVLTEPETRYRLRCNLALAIVEPIARGTWTEYPWMTRARISRMFSGASTKGASRKLGGWRTSARLAEGESAFRRRREVKGHVTGGQAQRGWGWEEVEVSWFLRCRTEVLSVPQELSRDTDVRERLSSLPRVIVVPRRSLFFCKPRFLCVFLRVSIRSETLFPLPSCPLCLFLATASGKLSKYRSDIFRLRSESGTSTTSYIKYAKWFKAITILFTYVLYKCSCAR